MGLILVKKHNSVTRKQRENIVLFENLALLYFKKFFSERFT